MLRIRLVVNNGWKHRAGAINKPIELVIFKEWDDLSFPEKIIGESELDGDKMSGGGDGGNGCGNV